jgi:hypothetical protein
VTVQASSKGIVQSKTFRVLPFLGKTLKLEAGTPIIAFGENGGFRVEVLDEAGEPVPIPENITFKYEILEGAQWGVLFDYYTWQTGSVVEGAPSVIDFFTADTAQYEDKRVVVRVSSSDAGLTADTAEVLILPGLLKVTVTPATLRYGERAEIVAEGVYRDGVLTSLDPSVLYSYEIVQAQDAGYLTIGSDTTRRDLITDVGPTASLIALKESPQPDSVKVIVRVTAKEEVILGRIDTIRGRPPLPPVVGPLLKRGLAKLQDYVEHVGVVKVVVKSRACEEAPPCPSTSTIPLFSVVTKPNGFGGVTICDDPDAYAAFKPIGPNESDQFIQPLSVKPCFDPTSEKLKFSIEDGLIQVNTVMDYCYDNILAKHLNLITDMSQISPDDACDAIQDVKDHSSYPVKVTRWGGYLIGDILKWHELKHKFDFERIVLDRQLDLAAIYPLTEISCNLVADLAGAQGEATEKMKNWIKNIIDGVLQEWNSKIGKRGSVDRKKYEQNTHKSPLVTVFIESYINELQARYQCPQ